MLSSLCLEYININGKLIRNHLATLQIDNGAFRYGYGLFETMLVEHGVVQLCDYHLERLFAGMRQLYQEIPVLMTKQYLHERIMETVAKNDGNALCRVRLQVFSGAGGIYSDDIMRPGFVIECFPLTNSIVRFNENGLVTGVAHGLNKAQDSLSSLKSCNALIYAIGARQARANLWNDALIRNAAGRVMETTIGNLFWIKNGVVYTPPIFEGCIAGVMRRHIIEKAGNVWESILTDAEMMEADEVFMTNAIRRIKWIKTIGDKSYTNKITASLFASIFPNAV